VWFVVNRLHGLPAPAGPKIATTLYTWKLILKYLTALKDQATQPLSKEKIMQRSQLKTISDLTSYLDYMETRMATLEKENMGLKNMINHVGRAVSNLPTETVQLPRTGLVSRSFFKRSFSVWVHFVFAQLVIGLLVLIAYAVLIFGIPAISNLLAR
jgi:hypothetical protein